MISPILANGFALHPTFELTPSGSRHILTPVGMLYLSYELSLGPNITVGTNEIVRHSDYCSDVRLRVRANGLCNSAT